MFRKLLFSIGAVGIVVGSFVGTLFGLDYYDKLCPNGVIVAMSKPYEHVDKHAYRLRAPIFPDTADTNETPRRSPIVVCEGNKLLGPGHSILVDIASAGNGRFSHYMGVIFFSASDNSDPNSNGRNYSVVIAKGGAQSMR